MPKQPVTTETKAGADAVPDQGDAEAIGIMDVLGKLGGNDARPEDPIAADEDGSAEAEDIETPKGMP